jgi:hypothetical protein
MYRLEAASAEELAYLASSVLEAEIHDGCIR